MIFFILLDNLGYSQEAGRSNITFINTKLDAATNAGDEVDVDVDDDADFSTPDLDFEDLFLLKTSTPKHQPSSKDSHRNNGEYSNNFTH